MRGLRSPPVGVPSAHEVEGDYARSWGCVDKYRGVKYRVMINVPGGVTDFNRYDHSIRVRRDRWWSSITERLSHKATTDQVIVVRCIYSCNLLRWWPSKTYGGMSMLTPEEFRQRLREVDGQTVMEEYLLVEHAKHVAPGEISFIGKRICKKMAVDEAHLKLWIVGSAKLGFSLSEKRLRTGVVLPRYRMFRPESDIDVAIVHSKIFEVIWDELSSHAHRAPFWPWNSASLGDYLVCGWLRPDHFPRRARLRKCDEWWDCFRALSNEAYLGRRKVRGGLFYSSAHLEKYLRRSIDECRLAEDFAR